MITKNFNTELDFILEELVTDYENQFKGIKFYSEESHKTIKEEITQKLKTKFGIKEWETDLLYYNLLVDKKIKSIEPLSISLDGLVCLNNGGYTQKHIQLNSENKRIRDLENSAKKNAYRLVIFTALLALGTLIPAWFFAIEIWEFYHSIKHQ
jgi:hypothetical protein